MSFHLIQYVIMILILQTVVLKQSKSMIIKK